MNDRFEEKLVIRILCATLVSLLGFILFVTLFIMSLLDATSYDTERNAQQVCECMEE